MAVKLSRESLTTRDLAQLAALGIATKSARERERVSAELSRLPHGTEIARFAIEGEPLPWRAPIVWNKIARSDPRTKAWKETCALAAHAAGRGQAAGVPPYEYPVKVTLVLCHKATRKRDVGKPWATRPDLVNLQKAIEDAFSGNVFKKSPPRRKGEKRVGNSAIPPSPVGRILADDNLIVCSEVHKVLWTRSMVVVRISAHDGLDAGILDDFLGP